MNAENNFKSRGFCLDGSGGGYFSVFPKVQSQIGLEVCEILRFIWTARKTNGRISDLSTIYNMYISFALFCFENKNCKVLFLGRFRLIM